MGLDGMLYAVDPLIVVNEHWYLGASNSQDDNYIVKVNSLWFTTASPILFKFTEG
jgi:hypothetical protein